MILERDWLWDKKISVNTARSILKNPADKRFIYLAGILLARKNTPQEVLKHYIKPVVFLTNWNRIKRQMRRDSWNEPRIEFWQAIYEKLKEKYSRRGIIIPKTAEEARPQNAFCKIIADRIRQARKKKGLTQVGLAKKLSVSQQLVSRIESGRENISLLTLKKIVNTLDAKLDIDIS